jgi:hypothetical protein
MRHRFVEKSIRVWHADDWGGEDVVLEVVGVFVGVEVGVLAGESVGGVVFEREHLLGYSFLVELPFGGDTPRQRNQRQISTGHSRLHEVHRDNVWFFGRLYVDYFFVGAVQISEFFG